MSTAKVLHVNPERHFSGYRREEASRNMAKELRDRGGYERVVLFLEGLMHGETVEDRTDGKYRVAGIETSEIINLVGKMSSAMALIQYYAYKAAHAQRDTELANLIGVDLNDNIRNIVAEELGYRLDCLHVQGVLIKLGIMQEGEMDHMVEVIRANPRTKVPEELRRFLEKMLLERTTERELEEVTVRQVVEMTGFFAGAAEVLPYADPSEMRITQAGIEDAVRETDAGKVLRMIHYMDNILIDIRDMGIARHIVQTDFDAAVLNIGKAHLDGILPKLLGSSGVRVYTN